MYKVKRLRNAKILSSHLITWYATVNISPRTHPCRMFDDVKGLRHPLMSYDPLILTPSSALSPEAWLTFHDTVHAPLPPHLDIHYCNTGHKRLYPETLAEFTDCLSPAPCPHPPLPVQAKSGR